MERPSRTILAGPDRAPARAMLRALGLSDKDFDRPLIGVANTWAETTPCNAHLRQLGAWVKEGVSFVAGVRKPRKKPTAVGKKTRKKTRKQSGRKPKK